MKTPRRNYVVSAASWRRRKERKREEGGGEAVAAAAAKIFLSLKILATPRQQTQSTNSIRIFPFMTLTAGRGPVRLPVTYDTSVARIRN